MLFLSCALFCAGSLVAADTVSAQDSLGYFHVDPVRFFSEQPASIWVGNGRFLMNDYSDTLTITPDSTGRALVIRRVLVDVDKSAVISRGGGVIRMVKGDSVYAVSWSERRYPHLTGQMIWQEGRWVITFAGEWSAWSIRIQYDTPASFAAVVARSLGSFPAVEIAGMTYRLQTGPR